MAAKNRYQGVNAHLMSYLQNEIAFKGFHNYFVIYLASTLNDSLAENYHAATEDTLKILRTFTDAPPAPKVLYPDISLRQESPHTLLQPTLSGAAALYVPLPTIEENKEPLSVAIYEQNRAKPVAVIEMLSPGNKISADNRREYKEKRYLLTQAGIVLVEVDLLHETPSVIDGVPVYPDAVDSTPYSIAITDIAHSNKTAVYQFGINQPIPTLPIPLLNEETVVCDFDAVYQEAFTRGRFDNYIHDEGDPILMNSYALPDQQKIRKIITKNS